MNMKVDVRNLWRDADVAPRLGCNSKQALQYLVKNGYGPIELSRGAGTTYPKKSSN